MNLPIREEIGRFKYTPEKDVMPAFEKVMAQLRVEMDGLLEKEDE